MRWHVSNHIRWISGWHASWYQRWIQPGIDSWGHGTIELNKKTDFFEMIPASKLSLRSVEV